MRKKAKFLQEYSRYEKRSPKCTWIKSQNYEKGVILYETKVVNLWGKSKKKIQRISVELYVKEVHFLR